MLEELYFAPLAARPAITLADLIEQFTARGRPTSIEEDSPEMCWVVFEGLESQLVVSTTPDEKKEVGLVTLEFSNMDGDGLLTEVQEVMRALGLSNDPDEQYR